MQTMRYIEQRYSSTYAHECPCGYSQLSCIMQQGMHMLCEQVTELGGDEVHNLFLALDIQTAGYGSISVVSVI